MVGWHHQLDAREFKQAPVVGDGQESLACCSPCDNRELDATELNNPLRIYNVFIHSSVNGHLICFPVLLIVSSAAVINEIYVSFSMLVS